MRLNKAQNNLNAARHVGFARPAGARSPTPVILRGFAACLSVPKACKGSDANGCTFAFLISIAEGLRDSGNGSAIERMKCAEGIKRDTRDWRDGELECAILEFAIPSIPCIPFYPFSQVRHTFCWINLSCILCVLWSLLSSISRWGITDSKAVSVILLTFNWDIWDKWDYWDNINHLLLVTFVPSIC